MTNFVKLVSVFTNFFLQQKCYLFFFSVTKSTTEPFLVLMFTAKLFKQGYHYHKLRKAFSKFFGLHNEFVTRFNVGLELLLQQGKSGPEFYGDLVLKFKKIRGVTDFAGQFRK